MDYSVKEGIAQLFAVRLMSQSVSLTCSGIINEFMTDLRAIQDVTKIKERYKLFLDCHSSQDGTCRDICSRLAAEWNIIRQRVEEGEYAKMNCPFKILNTWLICHWMFKAISIAFVFIDTYLTIAGSSDLPLSSVQEVVPKPETSSIEATKTGNKGIILSLECILSSITFLHIYRSAARICHIEEGVC